MIILSLDIGKKGGIVVWKDSFIHTEEFSFGDSMDMIYKKLTDLNQIWKYNIILIGEAFGQRAVVKKHSKIYGVIELFAERNNKQVLYFTDMSCRARVLGKGNGKRKDLVWEKYTEASSPDVADAMLFIDNYLILINEK